MYNSQGSRSTKITSPQRHFYTSTPCWPRQQPQDSANQPPEPTHTNNPTPNIPTSTCPARKPNPSRVMYIVRTHADKNACPPSHGKRKNDPLVPLIYAQKSKPPPILSPSRPYLLHGRAQHIMSSASFVKLTYGCAICQQTMPFLYSSLGEKCCRAKQNTRENDNTKKNRDKRVGERPREIHGVGGGELTGSRYCTVVEFGRIARERTNVEGTRVYPKDDLRRSTRGHNKQHKSMGRMPREQRQWRPPRRRRLLKGVRPSILSPAAHRQTSKTSSFPFV